MLRGSETRFDEAVDEFVAWFDRLDHADQLVYLRTLGDGPRFNHPQYRGDLEGMMYREALLRRSTAEAEAAVLDRQQQSPWTLRLWMATARHRIFIVPPIVLALLVLLTFMPNPGLSQHVWLVLQMVLLGCVGIGGLFLFLVLDPKDKDPFEPVKDSDYSREDILSRVLVRDERYLAERWMREKTGLTLAEYEELGDRERTILLESGILDLGAAEVVAGTEGSMPANGKRGFASHLNADGRAKKEYPNFKTVIDALHRLEDKYRLERYNVYLCETGKHWHVGHAHND